MISILIPSFQNNCLLLIKTLHEQGVLCGIPFEIIVREDSPVPAFKLNEEFWFARIETSSVNLGRAANRNRLAEMAQYPYLLFLDADAEIFNPEFLKNYIAYADDMDVVCGGTAYFYEPPAEKDKRLRWKYGIHREQVSSAERNQRPFDSFSAFNFLIRKERFKTIRFSEKISRYGHEDTLLGQELKKSGASVLHIDNPAFHTGIDDAATFLAKTREGVENLAELMKANIDFDSLGVKILRYFRFLKRLGLHKLMANLYQNFHVKWEKQLSRKGGPLWLFDLYKLTYLFFIKKAGRKPAG
ncbi:glycosyltransferase [Prolixibacter sp. NT017]|uniref:glycosyltransferase n=1 Tax=Prolixibacter sp. NT017 TaxID=2652390 RepID=UPI00128748BE|nr:glycosyltransferase [Prolixibacter sp. NT017]GET25483.1 glycosyl transferase [Prolixibacter sp. NT017]